MRDPVRIQRILNKLAAAWQHSPDLRLGQLVRGITSISTLRWKAKLPHTLNDLFNIEDDILESGLDAWLDYHNITVSGGWKS